MGSALNLPDQLARFDTEAVLYRFPGNLPDRVTRAKLEFQSANLLGLLSSEIDATVYSLLLCKSVSGFETQRTETFQRYFKLTDAALTLLRAITPGGVFNDLMRESLVLVERIFESRGAQFGEKENQEILFCWSSLRRAYRLLPKVAEVPPPDTHADQDKTLAREFNLCIMWSLMHFDCLRLALDKGLTPQRKILDAMVGGCRLSLLAYAAIRSAITLRPVPDEPLEEIAWDDEDAQLALESTVEREATLSGW
jgi:hypothetical protein